MQLKKMNLRSLSGKYTVSNQSLEENWEQTEHNTILKHIKLFQKDPGKWTVEWE